MLLALSKSEMREFSNSSMQYVTTTMRMKRPRFEKKGKKKPMID